MRSLKFLLSAAFSYAGGTTDIKALALKMADCMNLACCSQCPTAGGVPPVCIHHQTSVIYREACVGISIISQQLYMPTAQLLSVRKTMTTVKAVSVFTAELAAHVNGLICGDHCIEQGVAKNVITLPAIVNPTISNALGLRKVFSR